MRLLPVNARGNAIGEAIVVLGKHLSNQGLDFYFHRPVSHRRVIASFDGELPDRIEMLMDLTWCRFNGHGWYENGGRFLSAFKPLPNQQSLNIVTLVDSVVPCANALQA